ncbi:MAG: 50S ribosomal protein L25 [Treponema sp.]|nr:50S ribosomal protein L25 [Treponema sp.]MCQ2584155.1 50S ribosomal protein L25 [Treponema sp.]
MAKTTINAKVRTTTGKVAAKNMRKEGRIPAVVYNSKGEATMLEVDEVEFNKAWRASTKTTVFTLNVDGKECDVLIKDTEYNIRTDKVLHADFFAPDADQKVYEKMKVNIVGNAAGVLKGGFLVKHLPEIEIKATLANMPVKIIADVSKLNIFDVYTVADLGLPAEVELITPADTPLANVAPARNR